MKLKYTLVNLLDDSWPFLIWGFLLMLVVHFIPFWDIKQELESIFYESAGIKTIFALFSMNIFAAGLYLLVFSNKNANGWMQRVSRRLVTTSAKFGISFSAAAFGLYNGLALAELLTGDEITFINVIFTSLCLLLMAVLYWSVANTLSTGSVAPYLRGYERFVGVIMIMASPLMMLLFKNSLSMYLV